MPLSKEELESYAAPRPERLLEQQAPAAISVLHGAKAEPNELGCYACAGPQEIDGGKEASEAEGGGERLAAARSWSKMRMKEQVPQAAEEAGAGAAIAEIRAEYDEEIIVSKGKDGGTKSAVSCSSDESSTYAGSGKVCGWVKNRSSNISEGSGAGDESDDSVAGGSVSCPGLPPKPFLPAALCLSKYSCWAAPLSTMIPSATVAATVPTPLLLS